MRHKVGVGVEQIQLVIRYDGLDADRHVLSLHDVGMSLQGFSKVLALTGHFAAYSEYSVTPDPNRIRILASPPSAGSWEVLATVWLANATIFQQSVPSVMSSIFQFILAKLTGNSDSSAMDRQQEIIRLLIEKLGGNESTEARLFALLNKMVDASIPALRDAVTPIDQTCNDITLNGLDIPPVFNREVKKALTKDVRTDIGELHNYTVTISEIDTQRHSCKVNIANMETGKRVLAEILDPVVDRPHNPYVVALASGDPLEVVGKLETYRDDGRVHRFYISSAV